MKRVIRAVQDALPNSQLAVMPGQQHVAMDTASELFVGEVVRFSTAPDPLGFSA